MTTENRWRLPALKTTPAAARAAVVDFCAASGIEARAVNDLVLCVSEAVTNVVVRAQDHRGADETVDVSAAYADGRLRIEVRGADDVWPRVDPSGVVLGLPIISALTRSVQCSLNAAGGTNFVMTFDAGPSSLKD